MSNFHQFKCNLNDKIVRCDDFSSEKQLEYLTRQPKKGKYRLIFSFTIAERLMYWYQSGIF